MTITDLCQEIKNWFDVKRIFGKFEISDGTLTVDGLQNGQYFRIAGSVFNDGVYIYPAENLHDETFDGAIWFMAVPSQVVDLVADINAWEGKYGDVVESPYTSESFGGYSYSKGASGAGADSAGNVTWQSKFRSRLNKWRKI